jgi:hypothetical protein
VACTSGGRERSITVLLADKIVFDMRNSRQLDNFTHNCPNWEIFDIL